MKDKTIICKDCGIEFIHTIRDQEFYKEKGYENDPVRCRDCRNKRKEQRKDFNKKLEK